MFPEQVCSKALANRNRSQEKAMSQKLPSSLPCLDIRAALKQLEGNTELYLNLLKKFAEHNHDLSRKIADTLAKDDSKRARLLAHSAKGVSGSIGATELYLAAAALEGAITRGKTTNALQEFAAVLQTVLCSIDALLQQQGRNVETPAPLAGDNNENNNINPETLLPLLDKLDAHLRAGDFKALKSYAALQQSADRTAVSGEVDTWEGLINLFEYKQVAEKLAMLRLKLRCGTF